MMKVIKVSENKTITVEKISKKETKFTFEGFEESEYLLFEKFFLNFFNWKDWSMDEYLEKYEIYITEK